MTFPWVCPIVRAVHERAAAAPVAMFGFLAKQPSCRGRGSGLCTPRTQTSDPANGQLATVERAKEAARLVDVLRWFAPAHFFRQPDQESSALLKRERLSKRALREYAGG